MEVDPHDADLGFVEGHFGLGARIGLELGPRLLLGSDPSLASSQDQGLAFGQAQGQAGLGLGPSQTYLGNNGQILFSLKLALISLHMIRTGSDHK